MKRSISAEPIPRARTGRTDRDQQQFLFVRCRARQDEARRVCPFLRAAEALRPTSRQWQLPSTSASLTWRRFHASPSRIEGFLHHFHDVVDLVADRHAGASRRARGRKSARGQRLSRLSGSSGRMPRIGTDDGESGPVAAQLATSALAWLPATAEWDAAAGLQLRALSEASASSGSPSRPKSCHEPFAVAAGHATLTGPGCPVARDGGDQREGRIAEHFALPGQPQRARRGRPIRTPVKLPGPKRDARSGPRGPCPAGRRSSAPTVRHGRGRARATRRRRGRPRRTGRPSRPRWRYRWPVFSWCCASASEHAIEDLEIGARAALEDRRRIAVAERGDEIALPVGLVGEEFLVHRVRC